VRVTEERTAAVSDRWTGDAALRAEANLLHASATWTAAAGGSVTEGEGFSVFVTPAPMRAFNHIIVTSSSPATGPLLDAVSRFQHGPIRFRLRLRAEFDGDGAAFRATSLVRHGGIPSLALRRAPAAASGQPSAGIRPVRDRATLADHIEVVAEAFGWREEDLARVFTPDLPGARGWHGWVAYKEGAPVAAAQAIVHGGVCGLYYIGTKERYRRRGLGALMTRTAIADGAAQGCNLFTLQASPLGYPIYERLGFAPVAEYHTYVAAEDSA
jgi:ribosomal protein S18 acetylase RimI-like enzyme